MPSFLDYGWLMPGEKRMINQVKSKNIPLIILAVIVALTIVEELLIGEGGYGVFLQLPQHRILRFLIRGIYALVLFIIGYKGIQQLGLKWVTRIWLLWYGLAIIMIGIRILLYFQFQSYFNSNFFNFLIPFYSLLLTPFPYFFLWMLTQLFNQKKSNN